jgi:hypothetical protein
VRASSARKAPTLAVLVGLLFVLGGLLTGLQPLNDNSFLTHLATGRLIVDLHHIPHHDPYTFTAAGEPWVVQSWLASLVYGLVDRWWGGEGLLVLMGALAATLGGLVWTLTRPAGALIGRLLVAGLALGVGLQYWVERPLLFGLIALALALLAAEGRLDPRWLVPAMWVWVNAHGSFPLGLVALAVLALGRRLDGASPATELRALRWAALGVLAGAVNPLGPRLLVFPLELLARSDVLRHILEWQSPTFQGISQRVFLVQVAVAIAVLVRRPSFRAGLPLAVFTAAALLGARNVVVASLVITPGLAVGLAGLGSITGAERPRAGRPAAIVLGALGLLIVISSVNGRVFRLDPYPEDAVAWMDRRGLFDEPHRVAAPDYAGNFLEARDGAQGVVFMDDRYDMFPVDVVDDYITLLEGRTGWDEVLDRRDIDTVLWTTDDPTGQLLTASTDWVIVYHDDLWLVARRR